MAGRYAFSFSPNHHRRSAPSAPPKPMARIAFHMRRPSTPGRERRATVRVCSRPRTFARAGRGENTMRTALVPALSAALIAAALAACSQHSRQNAANERLRANSTSEWKWRTDQLPDTEDSFRPVADRLPKVDPATQEMRLRYWEDVLHRLDAISRAGLSAKEQVNYDVYRAQIATLIANQRFRDFEMPANSDTTFWTDLGYTARRPFRHRVDYEHWIAQMRDVPRYFHEQMDEMRAGMKRGFTPPRITMAGRDGSITAVTDAAPEPSLFYAPSPEELLMRAAWIAKRFDGKAGQFFGYLPRARFAIKPVPEDLAAFYTAGRGGPGVYLLNTYDLPSRPLYNLTALTLHESAPGHAFQMPIAMEHKDQPMFRQLTYISAYGEGWALYCEQLGLEMGMYESAYERFGMLGYQIWRAARLVVDTGIHAQGWTREQAMDYLKQYTALPEHEIATEVDRYIAWPGQALSYYLGERTLLEARSRAEKALGDRFNVRAFHDAVLELGSVPLPVLETQIDRFIAGGGRGPYPDME